MFFYKSCIKVDWEYCSGAILRIIPDKVATDKQLVTEIISLKIISNMKGASIDRIFWYPYESAF
jgi:hypothetical protein